MASQLEDAVLLAQLAAWQQEHQAPVVALDILFDEYSTSVYPMLPEELESALGEWCRARIDRTKQLTKVLGNVQQTFWTFTLGQPPRFASLVTVETPETIFTEGP